MNLIETIFVPNLSQATGATAAFAGRSGDAGIEASMLFIKQRIVLLLNDSEMVNLVSDDRKAHCQNRNFVLPVYASVLQRLIFKTLE